MICHLNSRLAQAHVKNLGSRQQSVARQLVDVILKCFR